MFPILTIILALAILLGFMTLGAVLLVRFVFAKLSRPRRILLASLTAPLGLVAPISLISLADGSNDIADVLIALIVGAGFFSVILCWPIANFATKRLDRLTEFDIETFT